MSCDRTFGSPKEGISIGPIKFSQRAELVNARMAMVGYAILAYVGYNQVSHHFAVLHWISNLLAQSDYLDLSKSMHGACCNQATGLFTIALRMFEMLCRVLVISSAYALSDVAVVPGSGAWCCAAAAQRAI